MVVLQSSSSLLLLLLFRFYLLHCLLVRRSLSSRQHPFPCGVDFCCIGTGIDMFGIGVLRLRIQHGIFPPYQQVQQGYYPLLPLLCWSIIDVVFSCCVGRYALCGIKITYLILAIPLSLVKAHQKVKVWCAFTSVWGRSLFGWRSLCHNLGYLAQEK